MTGLPQFNIRVCIYPRWNGGWTVFFDEDQGGFAVALGFLAIAIQWVPNIPRISVACSSCGDVCELSESSSEAVRQKAWAKGWLINQKDEWFCWYCKADQVANPHVIAAIYRRFGEESCKRLNSGATSPAQCHSRTGQTGAAKDL